MTASPAWAGDVERWVAELRAGEAERKVVAARRLGRSGKAAVEPLLEAFDARQAPPRLTAAIAASLGQLKDPRALEPLMGAWDFLNSMRLQMGQEFPAGLQLLRAAIVEAVGAIGTDRAEPLLEQAINDRDSLVVQKAAWALGASRDKRAVEALIALLGKGGAVAQTAFEALGAIGDPRGASALKGYLKNDDAAARIQAAYALSLNEGPSYRKILVDALVDASLERADRVLAAYYLAKLGDRVGVDNLAAAAKNGAPGEKLLAIQALGKCGNPKATASLIAALGARDEKERLLAVRALGQLGGGGAVRALRGALTDRDAAVKKAARQALEELGQED